MRTKQNAFTLVELMVATAVLTLLLVILLTMTNTTATAWRYGAAKSEQFQEARKAYDTMTRRISEATLNTYWDYFPPLSNANGAYNNAYAFTAIDTPTYTRQSELRFRVVNMPPTGMIQGSGSTPYYPPCQGIFFQAPLGVPENQEYLFTMNNLLNNWGYFVEVLNTKTNVPTFLSSSYPNRYRSRLMEMEQGTEYNGIYNQDMPSPRNLADPYARTKDPLYSGNPANPGNLNAVVPASDDKWFTVPLSLPITYAGDAADGTPGVGAEKYRPAHVLAENILALIVLPKLSPEDTAARAKDPTESGNLSTYPSLTQNFTYHSKQTSNYAPSGPIPPDPYINPKNQLPPVVQVAMFAIDEQSAQKLARANQDPTLNLASLFIGTGGQLFTNSANLETSGTNPLGDLNDFENNLIKLKLSYRLFNSNVSILGAKWTRSQ